MYTRLILLPIFIIATLLISGCPRSSVPVNQDTGNLSKFADSMRDAGMGQTSSEPMGADEISRMSADEGIKLTGPDLDVEIFLFEETTKLNAARLMSSESGGYKGVLVWGKYLILIKNEPTDGHVRRILEILSKSENYGNK